MGAVHVHRYGPRGTALAMFLDRSPEILMSGPAGTGKSRACLEKLHALALTYPGFRGLIMRKTAASLGASALQTWRKYVIPEAQAAGTVWYYGGSSEEPPQYRYRNGSAIMIGGMDKATRIMSTEYDVIFAQEAIEFTDEDWESANSRLRNGAMPYQQLLADTNPSAPLHWLKQRCDRGQTKIYFSTHEENPVYFDYDPASGLFAVTEQGAAYIERLDALTGVRYYRLRKGLWVAAEGVIYEDWDEGAHVVDPFRIPDDWPRWWAVDFGFVNPFVCQFWAETPDGQLIMYREIYRTSKTVDQHAVDILDTCTVLDPSFVEPRREPSESRMAHEGRIWTEPQPQSIICDHDAEGRAQLKRQTGIGTKNADKRVLEGIERMALRLRPRGDGQPGVVFFRNARVGPPDPRLIDAKRPTCTVEEIPGYVWLIRPTPPTITTQRSAKEEPLKENDHGCDASRYLITYRDPIKRPGIKTA